MKRPAVPIVAILLAAALVALLVYGVVGNADDTTLESAIAKGEYPVAPGASVALPRLEGDGAMSLAALRGQVVVLNFWASWCGPCESEAPVLVRAQQRLKRSDAGTVLGVTYKDDADASRAFARRTRINYPSLRDDKLDLAPKFGTINLPETFVLDRQGRIVALSRGEVSEDFLAQAIERAKASS